MPENATIRSIAVEDSPLQELADLLHAIELEGPRRHAAAHIREVELRELGLRVLEDFDHRLRLVEEMLKQNPGG